MPTEVIQVPSHIVDPLAKKVIGKDISWVYCPTIIDENIPFDGHTFQFAHVLYGGYEPQSDLCMPLLYDFLLWFQPLALIRAKLNLTTRSEQIHEGGYHTDITDAVGSKYKTAVLYLNDCDGYTKFLDTGEKVQSKKGRMVCFDGKREHTGSNTTDAQARFVLNLNYIPK